MEPSTAVQNLVVMRHGDRMDVAVPMWLTHADRPWDPPLTDDGLIRAWTTGKRLRAIGFPIHRVIVSPFLRCLQTAREVVSALCAIVDDETQLLAMETSEGVAIDPSKVKVSIEYGLCEALCVEAIKPEYAPKDGIWFPDLSDLEAKLPIGTIDHSVDMVYKELPQWKETLACARSRYYAIFKDLANKFPHENLLLVTHGEGVGVSVSSFLKDAQVFEVEYCAYSHLQRPMSFDSSEVTETDFKVLTANGKTGVHFLESIDPKLLE
ncbi:Histidine phosphatase superfamily clade-1 protein [Dioscorea alata]|uniref:Histidine phosphatase superfamily clade-1 protein n=1 Tax=Dioscorea alata TaxID=55571 RepID=A0ACB7WVQ1_DIOAL|nr:Histidine phosphatase superfamily clade-1 protein [Dioscorea alata]